MVEGTASRLGGSVGQGAVLEPLLDLVTVPLRQGLPLLGELRERDVEEVADVLERGCHDGFAFCVGVTLMGFWGRPSFETESASGKT